jgi:hypothetical protein
MFSGVHSGDTYDGEWLRAEYLGRRPLSHTRTALVELSSTLGGVVIQIQPRAAAELQ